MAGMWPRSWSLYFKASSRHPDASPQLIFAMPRGFGASVSSVSAFLDLPAGSSCHLHSEMTVTYLYSAIRS